MAFATFKLEALVTSVAVQLKVLELLNGKPVSAAVDGVLLVNATEPRAITPAGSKVLAQAVVVAQSLKLMPPETFSRAPMSNLKPILPRCTLSRLMATNLENFGGMRDGNK